MTFRIAMLAAILSCLLGCKDTSLPSSATPPDRAASHQSSLDWFLAQQLDDQRSSTTCSLIISADQGRGTPAELRFTLRNPGAQDWIFETQSPPWEWCGPNLQILAVESSGRVLDTVHPPCSPVANFSATIRPGESVTGNLDLGFVIDDIEPALKRGPVAVAWTYRFRGPNETSCFATGALALAKMTPN